MEKDMMELFKLEVDVEEFRNFIAKQPASFDYSWKEVDWLLAEDLEKLEKVAFEIAEIYKSAIIKHFISLGYPTMDDVLESGNFEQIVIK